MAYRGNPSIADRMKVLDFKASLLRKQDDMGAEGAAGSAAAPAPVSPPMDAPPAPPMGGPSPDEMMAAQTGQVYGSNEEALADAHSRLTEIAVDLTNHKGTIDMQATMDNLQMDLPDRFGEHITRLRDEVEGLCKIIKIIRSENPEMIGHGAPGAEMGMDPMMASQGEMPPQNMPAPGPEGMPPGAMANAGPMGGM
jgi:hypothetical protein